MIYDDFESDFGNQEEFEQDDFVPSDDVIYDEEQPAEDVPEEAEEYQPVSVKKHGQANIVVVGVGGAGNNAVNNMVRAGIKSAEFVVMNTDLQALNMSIVDPRCRIQLGDKTTDGLGAGSNPEVGRLAAEESRERIKAALQGIDLLFITAGMGGGTGTGAAPVIAEIAKSLGILTVGVVTKPFNFEGEYRRKNAEEGIKNLKDFVDTLLVIPNQKLLEVLNKDISFKRAFEIADDVLRQGIQSVSDVIASTGVINLDFEDVRTILSQRGLAHMGIGYGKGEKRILEAVRGAVFSPLLETDIEGATAIIINIIGGEDMKLSEVEEACDIVHSVVDPSANIIFGMATQPEKQDIEITIIATGFINKKQAPIKAVGSVPPRATTSVSTALRNANAAADNVSAERQGQPEPPKPVQQEDLFVNRPTFPQRPTVERQTQQPTPQYLRNVSNDSKEINPSHVNVPQRQVPTFLRRLRGEDDNNK